MSTTFDTQQLLSVVAQLNTVKPNKLLEITNYWNILGDGEEVTFTAYDGANFLNVILPHTGKINVMVRSDQLSKLVERTTSPNIQLTHKDDTLKFVGNGEYFLDIVVEDADFPTFDSYLPENFDTLEPIDINTSDFVTISNINSSAVSKSDADGIYTGFLLKNGSAISTDIIKICISKSLDLGDEILVPAPLLNIISSLRDENLLLWIFETNSASGESRKSIVVSSATCEVYGPLMEGIEEYVDVTQLSEQEFTGKVELPTIDFQSVIDRLSLFMGLYDKGTVSLVLDKKSIRMSTSSKSFEQVPYTDANGKAGKAETFSCKVNSLMLKDILNTVNASNFFLEYGNDECIKITTEQAEYYLALQDEDEVNG